MRTISRFSAYSSSLISLFNSTISPGSTNVVLPVADSSCTRPLILLLSDERKGITILPFRMDSSVSSATRPSCLAFFKIDCIRLDTRLDLSLKDLLIRPRSDEALSFIFPFPVMILLIEAITKGKISTDNASFFKFG